MTVSYTCNGCGLVGIGEIEWVTLTNVAGQRLHACSERCLVKLLTDSEPKAFTKIQGGQLKDRKPT